LVDANTLYTTFVQCCNSCILASYAVASYHFTNLNVYNFFLDYCKHFNISASPDQDAEREYAKHFDQEWKSRKCSGYRIVEQLHNNSLKTAFVQSRTRFGVEYIHQPSLSLSQIENRLKNEETLISVAIKESYGVHAYCVGFDNHGFYKIETRRSAPKAGIVLIKNIQSLGALQDSLLMFAHPTSEKASRGNSS